MTGHHPVFVVLVSGKLKPGFIDTFCTNFAPLAKYVEDNEDGCLTYQLSVGDKDPDSICIYERYKSREYCETVHWQSEAFKAFGAANRAAGDIWDSKTVSSFNESHTGYMTKWSMAPAANTSVESDN